MIEHISIKFSDFYTLRGRMGRVDFIIGLLVTTALIFSIHLLCRNYLLAMNNLQIYLGYKAFLQFLGLAIATPLYVKRFHDLNSSGYWVIFYWAVYPFTFEFAYSVELLTGIKINPFNELILLVGVLGLLMLLVQLLKSGNPEENQWGGPNERMRAKVQPPPQH